MPSLGHINRKRFHRVALKCISEDSPVDENDESPSARSEFTHLLAVRPVGDSLEWCLRSVEEMPDRVSVAGDSATIDRQSCRIGDDGTGAPLFSLFDV